MDLKEIKGIDPAIHWYYQSKVIPFIDFTEKYAPTATRVIDVGAGSGFFAKSVCDVLPKSHGVCIDPNYEPDLLGTRENLTFELQVENKGADVYIFADVLEHVENDLDLLTSYTDLAQSGSLVLISVPAFQKLWSGHDVFLEHYRRYTLNELEKIVAAAGLEVIEKRYLFPSLFPVALIKRKFFKNHETSDMVNLPKLPNWLMLMYFRAETMLFINRRFGLSVFIAAVKR